MAFRIGELVVYGGSGVCKVDAVGQSPVSYAEKGKDYYTLQPVYGTEVIYVPVDTKASMRRVPTRAEAEAFILSIPGIEEDKVDGRNLQLLTRHYQSSFQSHERCDLARLIKTIYARTAAAQKIGKSPSKIDEKYMRMAEELLHGELAAALDIPREEVPQYIEDLLKEQSKTVIA